MISNPFLQYNRGPESLVDHALEIHSVISVEISRQLLLALNELNSLNTRIMKLKQALDLIDQLDLFLESASDIKCLYPSAQSKLLHILKELKIQLPLIISADTTIDP